MTREEAIKGLKVLCKDFSGYKPNEEMFDMAIKALEQESILDKVRTEIVELDIYYDNDYYSDNRDAMFKCNDVLHILDRYKKESEVEK